MQIRFSKKFSKQYEKTDLKIKSATDKRLKIFQENPSQPQLNNHALTGGYLGYRSINITGNWRAIFSEYTDEKREVVITFHLLGTHPQLYG